MARGWSVAVALVLLVLKDEGAALGPLTVVSTPDNRFLQLYCPSTRTSMMGVIVGKYFAVVPAFTNGDDCEIRFNDLSASGQRFRVRQAYGVVTNYKLIKVCPGFRGYAATNMKESAFVTHNISYSGEFYYHRRSDEKFYKKTIKVLEDSLCETGWPEIGCTEGVTCDDFYDNDTGYFMIPWIIINGQPIGYSSQFSCPGSSSQMASNAFTKLSIDRAGLLNMNPVAFENA